MSVTETVLVFVGAPLAIAGVFALFIFGASARRAPRYRPGRPFEFTPVWFLAAPTPTPPGAERAELTAGSERPAIGAPPEGEPGTDAAGATRPATRKGGARGTW
jgi:hypothetical protein